MEGKKVENFVVLVATCFLLAHAFAGIYFQEISLKGGSTMSWEKSPISFLLIVFIEISVSLFFFWAFLIKKDVKSDNPE
jgi:hypothetical protein